MKSGLEIGKAKLSATGDVRGDFFLAQKEGFTTIAQAQQDNFIDAADTMTDARLARMADSTTAAQIKLAASKQREISRDAWLTYLAQHKNGSVDRGTGMQERPRWTARTLLIRSAEITQGCSW
jgi:hypothetical protein